MDSTSTSTSNTLAPFFDDQEEPRGTLIEVARIVPAPANQPRDALNRGMVTRIAETFRTQGPPAVAPVLTAPARDDSGRLDGFELFDGFHRYAAAVEAGMDDIQALVLSTREEAWALAPTLNMQGVQWSRKAALRHAAQGIREGIHQNGRWVRPIAMVAERYAAHGVNRHSLSRYLDRIAESDPAIMEYMLRARQQSTRRDGAEVTLPVWEMREKATEKRRDAAKKHLAQAANLLRGDVPQARKAARAFLRRELEKVAGQPLPARPAPPAPDF